ncbi:MAG: DUF1904 family protein [Acidaminobacteraceae bacterium]
MPHLRFRGLKKEEVMEVSVDLIDKLALAMDSSKAHFTIEYIPSIYILDGKESVTNHVFVEMLWFSRSDKTKQSVANIITDFLSKYNYENIAVYFIDMEKENYFKNGTHF